MKNNLDHTVIIFGAEIWSLQKNGGISRYCFELIKNLDQNGVNVRVLIGPNKNDYVNQLESRLKISLRSGSVQEISRGISEVQPRYQSAIYHATYYDSNALRMAHDKGLKTLVTVHDLIGEFFPTKIGWLRRRNNEQKKAVKQSDFIISVSNNTKSDLINSNKIKPSKIKVVYLGVSEFSGKNESNTFLNKPYVLHVGKRKGYKNFMFTVESIAHSFELKALNIIAFGGEEFSESEQKKIRDLQMEARVMYCSGDDALLGFLYKNASALVYPSLYEGFGMPPLEAMRVYCPVIASNRGSIPEVCGSSAKYFDPTSETSLQSRLLSVLKNPESDFVEKAHQHSLNFSWEKTALETLSVYQSLVGEVQ